MAADGGSWLGRNGTGGQVSAVELLTADAARGIGLMVEAGALVSLGTTSDGGALGITVTVNGDWRRDYMRSSEELAAWLAEAVPAIEDLCAAEGRQVTPDRPSAARGSRRRRS